MASSIFIHFTEDFLGEKFFQIPEMIRVKHVLDKSALGLNIVGSLQERISEQLHEMDLQSPPKRLITLLEILLSLSNNSDIQTILPVGFSANHHGDTDKINKVFEHIMQNYKQEIYVTDIANELNMSVASFSRYLRSVISVIIPTKQGFIL